MINDHLYSCVSNNQYVFVPENKVTHGYIEGGLTDSCIISCHRYRWILILNPAYKSTHDLVTYQHQTSIVTLVINILFTVPFICSTAFLFSKKKCAVERLHRFWLNVVALIFVKNVIEIMDRVSQSLS